MIAGAGAFGSVVVFGVNKDELTNVSVKIKLSHKKRNERISAL